MGSVRIPWRRASVLRDGDKILSVDGKYIDRFNKIHLRIILYGAKTIEVDRDGKDRPWRYRPILPVS